MDMLTRRSLLAASLATPALSQGWQPSRAIRVIVPFPAGGSPDIIARLMAGPMQAALGQNVVVENRTGAGATVGSTLVAREPADGHTILVAVISSLTAPMMMNPAPYDPVRDFRPVAPLAIVPTVLVVRPDFPARTVQEWHRVVQAAPRGSLTFGSGGVGNPAHLAGELYKAMTGADITHVPFRGSAPALIEVRARRVDFAIIDLPSATAMIQDRQLRPLAMGTATRVSAFPDLPTIGETVLPGFEAYSWIMWWLAAAAPDAAAVRLNAQANAILAQPDIAARAAQAGFLLTGGSEAEARRFVGAEAEKWARVIRERNIRFSD